jgi:hypothetical protein
MESKNDITSNGIGNPIKCIKMSLKTLQRNNINYEKLYDAIQRVNKIVTLTYQFLRAYLIYQSGTEDKLIKISEALIANVFKILCVKASRGRPLNDKSIVRSIGIKKFYEEEFKSCVSQEISSLNLSGILDFQKKEILTSIENNIEYHFIDHLKHYVNEIFGDPTLRGEKERT